MSKTATKRVSVREIAEAMIIDPTPKTKHKLVDYEWEGSALRTAASCAIGGAAIILGVDHNDLQTSLEEVPRDGVPTLRGYKEESLAAAIFTRNDQTRASKRTIGKLILGRADEKTLNTKIKVEKRDYSVVSRLRNRVEKAKEALAERVSS